jgi:hypothetical protein
LGIFTSATIAARFRTRHKVVIVNRDDSVEHHIDGTTARMTPAPKGWNGADGRQESQTLIADDDLPF